MAQITAVEPIPIVIPRPGEIQATPLPGSDYYRQPHRRLVYSRHREAVFVKITADDGHIGWGESLASVAPQVATQIICTLLAPQLIGQDPLPGEALWNDLYHSMRDRGHLTGFFMDALAGCDSALWDLRGKILGVPVYTLLGGPFVDRVRLYASGVRGDTPAERAASARELVAQGFTGIKLHLTRGRRDMLATVAAVREALGPDVDILVDAHNIFDVAEAIRVGKELERYDVLVFEAPTNPEDVAGLAEIAAALQVRVATGETERSRYQFRQRFEARAVDVVQPDIGYVGLSEMRRIAWLAEAFHVSMAPHLSAGLGASIAATLHLVASIPNVLIVEFQPGALAVANQLLHKPLEVHGGFMPLPQGPGFGIDLDEAAIRAYEVKA